MTQIINLKTF